MMNLEPDEIESNALFLKNLNKLISRYKLCYSNIDEKILRKTQEFEQEHFYTDFILNPSSDFNVEDSEIKKTLDSGSAWIK